MRLRTLLLTCLLSATVYAQETRPANATNTVSVQANLVMVPAVVYDKHGLVKGLTKESFALSVDGKPQVVRYFDRATDVPLTVGLLVDTSRSQGNALEEEQKASQSFLESMLAAGNGSRPANKAFVMQVARMAELLQDVTDARPLLEAGLKQIGTQSPGGTEDEAPDASDNGKSDPTANAPSGSSPGNNGGYGRGPYGRGGRGGSGTTGENTRRGGAVLYDALFLASDDVMSKQNGRRALVVLTDGVDRHSKESLTEAIEAAQRANTVVYAIYSKGDDHRGFGDGYPGGRTYDPYDPYDPYGPYGRPTSPGSGGRPGTDGTYAQPDGKKILERICGETGGHMFEVKGKGAMEKIYAQIGDELRAQYRLGFTPAEEAASAGHHKLQLTLTSPDAKKDEVQTREGYYFGPAKSR